jgi:carboxyl-terminal processing protease
MKSMIRILIGFVLISTLQATAGAGHGDFSDLSFTEAFDSLFFNFSTCYPFTEWKSIDWQRLYSNYYPQIEDAQNRSDTSAYKLAVRRFIYTFPDGHVRVRGDYQELFFTEIGGGLGLTLIELDDGSIVVNRILSGGPAEQEGIEVGAAVTGWDGLPVQEALQNTDLIWEGKPPAILEAVRLSQLRRLIRMPVGVELEITFSNPGQVPVTKNLTAVDDGMETWDLTRYTQFDTDGAVNLTLEDLFDPVQYEILESGYGYLKNRILVEFDSQGNILPTFYHVYSEIVEAIDFFRAAQVPGVIVDVRDNPGGFDRLAALFGSVFYDHEELYEHASFYNPETGQFEIVDSFTIYLEPGESYYGGPVICLVNAGTSSSAEGVAMAVQRLPQGHVLGFYGTHGSFALTGGETLMPAGLAVSYPLGRSLDANFMIQIDSDSTMRGGVIPDIRVPVTRETMNARYADSEDVELNYAVEYLDGISSVIDDPLFQPGRIQLLANYPNPFNALTAISYVLPEPAHIKLTVYNINGREIAILAQGLREAGRHITMWNGADSRGREVESGIYFCKMTAGHSTRVRKMVFVR